MLMHVERNVRAHLHVTLLLSGMEAIVTLAELGQEPLEIGQQILGFVLAVSSPLQALRLFQLKFQQQVHPSHQLRALLSCPPQVIHLVAELKDGVSSVRKNYNACAPIFMQNSERVIKTYK